MKDYLDIKTIKVSNLVVEYIVKMFFNEMKPLEMKPLEIKKEFVRIVEIDKLVNKYLSEIKEEEIKNYIKEINKCDYKTRPCFAFTSDKLTKNPLRLYLNSFTEGESVNIDDFSLASDYYFEDLETGKIEID